jgi:phosphoribosylamine--glycine ligase
VDEMMAVAVEPTLAALRARGIDYRGVLYAGLMLTSDGPKVLEYNVRFADPETQVVVGRLRTDLVELLVAAADGDLSAAPEPSFTGSAAVTVVCATEGYPTAPRTGDVIAGIEAAGTDENVRIYTAGVAEDDLGRLLTAGGRVLNVTGYGPSLAAAREAAYNAVDVIHWPGMQYRSDIAAAAAESVP